MRDLRFFSSGAGGRLTDVISKQSPPDRLANSIGLTRLICSKITQILYPQVGLLEYNAA